MRHVTRTAAPPVAASFDDPVESAVALGQGSENFQVAIRVRPPLGREGSGRSFAVKSVPLLGVKGGSGEQISIQTSAGSAGRSERKEFVFSRV